MFTLKLFNDHQHAVHFTSAEELTVADESPYLKSVTCHPASGEDGKIYFVGTVTEPTAFAALDGRVFDRAVIENAEGRTTEVIRVRAVPPASEVHLSSPDKSFTAARVDKGGQNNGHSQIVTRPPPPSALHTAAEARR